MDDYDFTDLTKPKEEDYDFTDLTKPKEINKENYDFTNLSGLDDQETITQKSLDSLPDAETINDLMTDSNFAVVGQYMDQRFGMQEDSCLLYTSPSPRD